VAPTVHRRARVGSFPGNHLNSTGFRLSCTVRVEKADSAALFGSLRIYLERFGEVYDELDRQKKELLRESEKGNKAQDETMGVHNLLKVGRLYFLHSWSSARFGETQARLEARRPLENLAHAQAAEMGRLAAQRAPGAPEVPSIDEELVRSMERLHDWALKELLRGQSSAPLPTKVRRSDALFVLRASATTAGLVRRAGRHEEGDR